MVPAMPQAHRPPAPSMTSPIPALIAPPHRTLTPPRRLATTRPIRPTPNSSRAPQTGQHRDPRRQGRPGRSPARPRRTHQRRHPRHRQEHGAGQGPRALQKDAGRAMLCVKVKIRDGNVANRPIYVALAVTVDGHHQCHRIDQCADPARGQHPLSRPTEQAALKCVYLAVTRPDPSGKGRQQLVQSLESHPEHLRDHLRRNPVRRTQVTPNKIQLHP